ncbi:MAG TPA: hypothetical protein VES39_00485, partial [Rhodospirillales bacterium]|nr:hypothetical protein [Rhodospirillales bacterium]
MLDARAEELAIRLFPTGHYDGPPAHARDWCIGALAGEPGQSARITIRGPRRGLWVEHADKSGGDMLDLVTRVCCHGSRRDALAWARDYLGLGPGEP